MKNVQPTLLPQSTLFETYAPVEQYYRSLESNGPEPPRPPVKLQAVDAYAMHLMASMLPWPRSIIDLAGQATWGASTVLWSSKDRGGAVSASMPGGGQSGDPRWPSTLSRYLEETDPPQAINLVSHGPDSGDPTPLPARLVNDDRSVLVTLATMPWDSRQTIDQLRSIFAANRRAIVLMLPLGLIGEDPAVEELLTWTRPAGLRLALLREVSPFLASSRMAVVHSAEDGHTPEALKRIRWLFQSNFDFLALAHQSFTLSHTNALHDAQLKTLRAKCGQMEQAVQDWERQYHIVSERERIVQERALWMENQLAFLTSGTGWALLQVLMRLRLKLFPRGSFRERMGRSVMRNQRRLRQLLRGMRTSGRGNHTPRPRLLNAARART